MLKKEFIGKLSKLPFEPLINNNDRRNAVWEVYWLKRGVRGRVLLSAPNLLSSLLLGVTPIIKSLILKFSHNPVCRIINIRVLSWYQYSDTDISILTRILIDHTGITNWMDHFKTDWRDEKVFGQRSRQQRSIWDDQTVLTASFGNQSSWVS